MIKKIIRFIFVLSVFGVLVLFAAGVYVLFNVGMSEEHHDRIEFHYKQRSDAGQFNRANLKISGVQNYHALFDWDNDRSIEIFNLLPAENIENFLATMIPATREQLQIFGCPDLGYNLRPRWPSWIPKNICDYDHYLKLGYKIFYHRHSFYPNQEYDRGYIVIVNLEDRLVFILAHKDRANKEAGYK